MTSAGQGTAIPRVSVITIFHDEERYIGEAIDSVLAQDFRDFELLLVDDGSSDSSSATPATTPTATPAESAISITRVTPTAA